MTILTQPALWSDLFFGSPGASPPPQWQALDTDNRWWFWSDSPFGGDSGRIIFTGPGSLPASLSFAYEVITPGTLAGVPTFEHKINNVAQTSQPLTNTLGATGTIVVTLPPGTTTFSWGIVQTGVSANLIYDAVVAVGEPAEAVQALLEWTASAAGTYPVAFYDLYKAVDEDAATLLTSVAAGDPREYTDTDVTTGLTYTYWVVVRDSRNNPSLISNVLSLSA